MPASQSQQPQLVTSHTARRNLAARFLQAGLPDAWLDARWLVEGALAAAGGSSAAGEQLSVTAADMLEGSARRRLAGEPVWRILGEREFWGLTFRLSPDTLEPRPDSETLIEAALAALGPRRDDNLAILDLGTGTGCLLVALLHECRQAYGVGVDICEAACETARGNAAANGVDERARFQQGDWLAGLSRRFDLVVSNPPYIASTDIAGLDIGVRDYDPPRALDGGRDGLDAYRILAAGLGGVLAREGLVVLEIGAGQEADVVVLMGAAGFVHLASRRDLGGHTRALIFEAG